ncbi:MAG TPA: hypothetical protein VFF68_06170 [Anaerolineaceae bacterium]|nr:hypothetical protein [Anaerolineaceae bacterium]
MTSEIVRWIVTLGIAAHGIGHLVFLFATSGVVKMAGADGGTWLLPDSTGGLVRIAGGVLWLVVTAGFIATAAGAFTLAPWWRTAAIAAAVASLVMLGLFWNGMATSWVINAALFNLGLLAAILIFKWPAINPAGA